MNPDLRNPRQIRREYRARAGIILLVAFLACLAFASFANTTAANHIAYRLDRTHSCGAC